MKALVVYGTRWGGTIDIAKTIGNILAEEGYAVDVFDAKSYPTIDSYDLIIVGSGISGGRWTQESEGFLEQNAAKFREKKAALFVSCGMVERESGKDKAREDYLEKISKKYSLTPIEYGVFGGFLDFNAKYNLLDRFLVNSSKKKLQKMGIDTTKPYDFRDWENIKTWTRDVIGNHLRQLEVQHVL